MGSRPVNGIIHTVFDLDGTLINIDPVAHLANEKKWDEFADATMSCQPIYNMLAFARCCQRFSEVLIVTAKPERLRFRTLNWLSIHGIVPTAMMMRPAHDYRSSPELKLALLKEHMEEIFGTDVDWKRQIMFAVEDRDKMVDAWRAAGITCLQCAPSLY